MGRSNNDYGKKDAMRRRPAADRRTAIDTFASGGVGVTKAIQDFRKRKDKKRTETAKALRRYKKTMKQEGYEPGMGASRKRRPTTGTSNEEDDHDGKGDDDDDVVEDELDNQQDRSSPNNKKKRKHNKSNPFTKSLQKAQQNRRQRDALEAQRQANEKERQQKIQQRRKRTKQLRQRTSKGQPVMKHMITDILRKLQKEDE